MDNSIEVQFTTRVEIDYPHVIERGVSARIGQVLQRWIGPEQNLVVISDTTVGPLHAARICNQLRESGWGEVPLIAFPAGEESKSFDTHAWLIDQLIEAGVHRRTVILAVGGGVVCDTAGYVAATFMRGIDYINIPTSLIAQLDAGIGGKVGVNHPCCKNLVGAFHHPLAVIVDPDFLTTLPVVEVRNGLAEAVKVAMIHSPDLFVFMEEHADSLVTQKKGNKAIDRVISESLIAKIELLRPDPFEADLRRVLNFGHTFAHPLEVADKFGMRHGFAVSVGMCISSRVALQRGMINCTVLTRLTDLLCRIGLPTSAPPVDPESVWKNSAYIRRIRANSFHFVVPTDIGSMTFIDDLDRKEFMQAYRGDATVEMTRSSGFSPLGISR